MPEILFITNERSLLEIIDQLKALVDARIDIVNDFSQGLKEIFFRQPAVVFIQGEIGGITGEKVASQVRALLDEKPIKLVLLHNKKSDWQVSDSSFDGSIDTTLPPPELIRQLRRQVRDSLNELQGMPADAGEAPQNDTAKFELSADSPKQVDEYTIDSIADIFPANLPDDWGASFPLDKQDAQTAAESFEPAVSTIKPGEEFTFDSFPDISSDDPAGSAIPPLVLETGPLQEPAWIYSEPWQETAGDIERPGEDVRPDDQEPLPHLIDGISDTTDAGMDFHQLTAAGSATAVESGVRPEPVPTFIDSPDTLGAKSTSFAATAGHSERSPAMADQAPTLPSAAQKDPPVFGGNASIQAGKGPEHIGVIPPGSVFVDDIHFRKDFRKKSSLTLKLFMGALILSICVATFFIVRDWLGVREQETVSVAPPPAPLPAPVVRDLPAFIPVAPPDSAYAASHPGWERREGNGLEFLIYRENGRIKAIQVIAGPLGVISAPFLKACIRETTGREDADNWVREKRNDFLVEKGTLPKKGELAVYRKMPEGDIRGFVLSFF